MAAFDAALARGAALDEATLSLPWPYQDKPMDVRYAFYRTLEDAQEAQVALATRQIPESRRILAFAQRAFGDLRGLVAGFPDSLMDRAPRDGEWSMREVLSHVFAVERRYQLQTVYAVERADSDPVRLPDDKLPSIPALSAEGAAGSAADIIARIGAARAETNRQLASVAPAAMTRPARWLHYDTDVRFRLHRFGAHIVEHVVHGEKTVAALVGLAPEARRMTRRVAAASGEVEGLGGDAAAREIERRVADRLASITGA
ncbi:MAG TPA: DinB family protein [Candidatus Limnocylindrales bacterium]|nr:DinB family protein [Candidatus Limnocylindrales bacterium]